VADDDHPEMTTLAADEISVLVVDDQLPFRLAARAVVRRAEGFALVGEAVDGEDAVAQVGRLRPALVLMDVNMPGIDGIEATRRIVGAHPGTTVFLCSTYTQEDLSPLAEGSGYAAYVTKEELGPELLRRLWDERTGS
jgi:DNA-binding NarL/FixJ family response regulator